MKILVTGGAGYIGGFMVDRLVGSGHEVVVVDSFERGQMQVNPKAVLVKGDLRERSFVSKVFQEHDFDGVIHFAAYIAMGESMENPYIYFYNNILASLNILEEMVTYDVKLFIFSSTAGVYGNPVKIPIPEDHPKNPENPYGESKWMVERILSWYFKTKGINSVALRYFNAAGAALDGSRGEAHVPESHLIPNLMQAVLNKRPFNLNGNDYRTKDGTCVRDYIHVLDLIEAHILALDKIKLKNGHFVYNVGTGRGYSNREVLDEVRRVADFDFEVRIVSRRPGDADELVADVSKIKRELGFTPKYSDLRTIVESAWKWHSKNQQ